MNSPEEDHRHLLQLAEREDARATIDRLSEKHLRRLVKATIDYVNRAEDLRYTHRAARIALRPTQLNFEHDREAYDLLRADLPQASRRTTPTRSSAGRASSAATRSGTVSS
jgi:hypothetical protein